VLRELNMAKKAKETKKEEVKKEVKKAPKVEKQKTKVWNGVGWEIVEEGNPNYKPGKQPQG